MSPIRMKPFYPYSQITGLLEALLLSFYEITQRHIHTQKHSHLHLHTQSHTYTLTQIHTYTYTHTHTQRLTHTSPPPFLSDSSSDNSLEPHDVFSSLSRSPPCCPPGPLHPCISLRTAPLGHLHSKGNFCQTQLCRPCCH